MVGYGARQHLSRLKRDDPVAGQWTGIDPLAEDFDNMSPYNYGLNNPLRFVDPTGMAALDTLLQGVNDDLPSKAVPGDIIEIEKVGSFELLPTASVTGEAMIRVSLQGEDRNPYTGFGLIGFMLSGGHEDDGYQYDINGHNLGPSPIMGYPMDFSRGNPVAAIKKAISLWKAARAARGGSRIAIQFGKTENQISHAFRHTDALGLDRALVQSTIQNHFKTVSSQVVSGKPFNQIIKIGRQKIQYTVFKLSDGTFNIGRIHGIK